MKRDRLYFSFLCLCCFLFCALDVQAQQDYWKGQVKDAVSGEPMIGVSVCVKGTGSGTITDFDGNFTVKASKGDILVISSRVSVSSPKEITPKVVLFFKSSSRVL